MQNKTLAALIALVIVVWPLTLRAQTLPAAYTTVDLYDAMQRVAGTISANPGDDGTTSYPAVRNTYDTEGRLLKVEQGNLSASATNISSPPAWGTQFFQVYRTTIATYDTEGRKLSEETVGSDGNAYELIQYGYDANGRQSCSVVRMNPAHFASEPAVTSTCTLSDPAPNYGPYGADRITQNTYDTDDELLTVTKAVGTAQQATYATYTYTADGQKQTVTDANQRKALMAYNGFDRLVDWYFPDPTATTADPNDTAASSTDYEAYTYDNNGNRQTLKKRDGRYIDYGYDGLDRVTSKTYPNGGATPVYYDYTLDGHMTTAVFTSLTSGQGVMRQYDGYGELKSDQTVLPGVNTTLGYRYDADGDKTQLSYSDTSTVTYHYDGLDRPQYVQTPWQSGTTAVATYTYDPTGHVSALSGGYSTSFLYDSIQRLQTHALGVASSTYNVQFGFSYNPASQMLSQTDSNDTYYLWKSITAKNVSYTTNGQNEYTAVGSTSPSYDGNGNMTSPDGATTYGYDIENRLTAAGGSTYNAMLSYDPLGRLYSVAGSATTKFVYDGDALVEEMDGSGNILRRYINGIGADVPLAWYEGSAFGDSNARYLRADHEGSVLTITDSTSSNVYGVNIYDEFGNAPATGNLGRFQYTGQMWIPEIGLYYYRARVYSPTLGRFMQMDPVGYADDLNLYAYVKNDPLDKTDSMGTDGGCVYTDGCEQIAKGMSQVADNVHLSVSVKAQATAVDIGVQVKATADRQTLDDGSIAVSARTATGGVALQAQATVDLTVGPASVGENATTVSVRSGLVGGQVSAGDQGVNAQVSVGPQAGIKIESAGSLPANAGAQLGSTRLPVGGAVKSLVEDMGQKMAQDARAVAGCGTNPCVQQ